VSRVKTEWVPEIDELNLYSITYISLYTKNGSMQTVCQSISLYMTLNTFYDIFFDIVIK